VNRTPLTELRLGAPGRPRSKDIARKLDVSVAYVSALETGKIPASDTLLKRYAAALGSRFAEVKRRFLESRVRYLGATARSLRKTLERLRA
jgi:transcriptional regulator with XRE-family HTH domain